MRPLKLAFLTSPLGLGGSEQQLFHLLSGLDRQRFVPIVIQLGGDLHEHWVTPIRDLDIAVFRLDRSLGRGVRGWRLAQLLRNQSVDIVHSWPRFANPYAAVAGRIAGIPVKIGSIRNDPTGLDGFGATQWLNSAGLDLVVANWDGAITRLPGLVASRTALRVVHNGVGFADPPDQTQLGRLKAQLGFFGSERLIGSVGRLDRNKNFEMALRVFATLAPKWPLLRLVILGEGSERAALVRLAASLGISQKVVLPGRTANAAGLLGIFDVCCLTSLTEGLPNAVMEASAAGVPVVATACGGVRELIDDGVTGYIVPQRDHVAMTARMDQLLSDRAHAGEMGIAGRMKMRAEFSVSRMVASTMSMYEEAFQTARTTSRQRSASLKRSQRDDAVKSLFSTPSRYLDRNPFIDRRAEIVRAMVGDPTGAAVLDLGCGDGRISLQFAAEVRRLTLADPSREMLDVARVSIPATMADRVTLTQASVETITSTEHFDVVLCLGVLAHVASKEDAVARLSALVRPGGVLLVQLTDADRLMGWLHWRFEGARHRFWLRDDYFLNRTGLDWLTACADEHGLRLEQTERYGFMLPGMGRLPLRWLAQWERLLSSRPSLHGAATDAILRFRKNADMAQSS